MVVSEYFDNSSGTLYIIKKQIRVTVRDPFSENYERSGTVLALPPTHTAWTWAPSDFRIFYTCNHYTGGQRTSTKTIKRKKPLILAVSIMLHHQLQSQPASLCDDGIQKLVASYDKCNYVEK